MTGKAVGVLTNAKAAGVLTDAVVSARDTPPATVEELSAALDATFEDACQRAVYLVDAYAHAAGEVCTSVHITERQLRAIKPAGEAAGLSTKVDITEREARDIKPVKRIWPRADLYRLARDAMVAFHTERRRRLFGEAYLQTGGNATESEKCAGFSEKTAYSRGQRLLKDGERSGGDCLPSRGSGRGFTTISAFLLCTRARGFTAVSDFPLCTRARERAAWIRV
jgi:hypothetical protein